MLSYYPCCCTERGVEPMVTLTDLVAHLPPAPDEVSLFPAIQRAVAASKRKLVVIDDDPTGTQTVSDVELLTTWDGPMLASALQQDVRLFFLLTNSRSLSEYDAVEINLRTAHQLLEAAQSTRTAIVVASRSDSTLRGHYPAEIFALERGMASAVAEHFDGHLVVPAFFEGGRYTIGDTHYVATPSSGANTLQPASETPFAQDSVFGYKTAYLPAWIAEKSGGHWKAEQVMSIELELIRHGGPDAVAAKLQTVQGGTPVVINAVGYGDLAVVVLGLLQAEAVGKRFLYRTAASFVRLRGGVEARPLLSAKEIVGVSPATGHGGLVIVGSYVPGSSAQLEILLHQPGVTGIEFPVEQVLRDAAEARTVSRAVGQQLEAAIKGGKVGVLFTSRQVIKSAEPSENLEIGRNVSHALVTALHEVTSCPRFIIAKGGITSHDVAQKGLGAARALILGQLYPGVPVWRLEQGPQSRFAGVPYVVFPGNVGGPESLAQAVEVLNHAGKHD
jgi:uncharacterized protein YgbK (DUF1537 family)